MEELSHLVPGLEEFETLLLNLVGAAVPDPTHEWDSSNDYSTFDKRIVNPELTFQVLAVSEAAIHQHVSALYGDVGRLLHAFWSGEVQDSLAVLIEMGERLEADGRVAKARQCYAAALSLALPLVDKTPQILALRRIGRVSLVVGDFPEALSYYQRSAEMARDSGNGLGEVIARTGLGNVRMHQGRWSDAHECYRSALALSDAEDDTTEMIKARTQLFNNMGNTATRLGQLEEAEEWLRSALAGWTLIDSPVDLAVCHYNLALLRDAQGRRSDVMAMYKRALALPIPSGQRSVIATDMAIAYVHDGQFLDAEVWSREAEKHAFGARSPYALGFMYQGRGRISLARGEEDGFIFFEKALEIAREKGYGILEAETLVDYAELRLRTGGVEEAQAYLERALEVFRESGSVREQARAEELLAQIASAPAPADSPLAEAAE